MAAHAFRADLPTIRSERSVSNVRRKRPAHTSCVCGRLAGLAFNTQFATRHDSVTLAEALDAVLALHCQWTVHDVPLNVVLNLVFNAVLDSVFDAVRRVRTEEPRSQLKSVRLLAPDMHHSFR